MKINMLCKTLLLAGLTAAMLTGCGKSGIPAETEVPAAAREQELSEAKLCRPIRGRKLLRQKPVPSAAQKRKVKAARE